MNENKELSRLTNKEYCLKDIVRIVNPKQQKLYIKHMVYPIDIYTTSDIETGEDLLIMLFPKKESQPLYMLWQNHELK